MTSPLRGVQTSTFWIDESGSKSTANRCFVVAGIKTRHPDDLLRQIRSVREHHDHWNELKFGRLAAANYRVFTDLVDVLEDSDARLAATVVDSRSNPFPGQEQWRAHAKIVSQLVIGNMNRNEVATVLMDGISTPPGQSLGRAVKRTVNSKLGGTFVTSAISLDSRSNDLLQAADLVAGAIFHERTTAGGGPRKEEKVKVARRLASAFGAEDLTDQHARRVNIMTLTGGSRRRPRLRVVDPASSAS